MKHSINKSPLRVCWLLQGDEGYGVRRAVLNLMEGLRRADHIPMAVCLGSGPMADELLQQKIPILGNNAGRMEGLYGDLFNKLARVLRNRRLLPQVAARLTEQLRGRRIDVLHFLLPTLVELGGRVATGIGCMPVWEMPNTVGANMPLRLSRIHLQWTCWRHRVLVLANSAYTAKTFGAWPVQARVFHLGVDTRCFDPDDGESVTRGALGIPESAVVLGVVSRLHPSKGQERVIEAMRLLGSSVDQPIHLLLLGHERDKDYAAQIRSLIRRRGLEDRIHFLGNVSDPQRFYAAMDLPINSRINAEPFGLSVVEAMMMGRPPIVYALGGPSETVLDGQTGWHIQEPTVESLASGLLRALNDRWRWPEMRTAARAHALAHFTVERQTDRYLVALNEYTLERRHLTLPSR